jgi:myo-inositol-1-phosphate synthase
MAAIKLAIVGIGNCASSLIQGIRYYKNSTGDEIIGLMHPYIGGYHASDIDIVAAFDIDARKVNTDVSEAIFAPPNCTKVFCDDIPSFDVPVRMGPVLDGYSDHMKEYRENEACVPADEPQLSKEDIVSILTDNGTDVLINYLPVGSEQASRFYAECALEAGAAFVNCVPVFIVSDDQWATRFAERGLPAIGDDIKAQLGATVTHRVLTDLFKRRGVKLERTYQLNTGGNTDFLNMVNKSRLTSKRTSKTEAVQSVAAQRLADRDIHIGPSDYVAWQDDNKVCFIRMEGKLFGDIPMNLELRLSVEDSPNSAGIAIDAIRCCKLARDRGVGGPLHSPSSYFMKHPPCQYPDSDAWQMTEDFIYGNE